LKAEKSVGGHVKKSITSPVFNRIIFHLAVRRKAFQQTNVQKFPIKIPSGC